MRARALVGGLALLLALAGGCRREEPAAGPGAAPPPAPDFTLPSLDGAAVALVGLRGRPVVVDFWATWCDPCVFQIPVLNAVHEAQHGAGVVVLGISVDAAGRDVVARFAEEHGIRYPVLLGDEVLAQRFGAVGYPSLYVIAPDGSVAFSHVGVVSQEDLEAALAAVQ